MATIGEIKVHVTACGCEELSHLIAMLEANIENLPMVVVKAMKALADSIPDKAGGVEIAPLSICGDIADPAQFARSIALPHSGGH